MEPYRAMQWLPIIWVVVIATIPGYTGRAFSEPQTAPPFFTDYGLPASLALCGEPVPLERRDVWEMLDREFTIAVWDRAQVVLWLKRAGRYFPLIEGLLAERQLPEDLKYLAVAESALRTRIRSHKGAVGPWQFMGRTALRQGLRKDRTMDERRDFERATAAALAYLAQLKAEFGRWSLAMAAYNCGEVRLRRDMETQQADDFYDLDLPPETERFIFRIAAIKLIMENPRQYGYVLLPSSIYQPLAPDKVQVNMGRQIETAELARALGVSFKRLKELNPQLRGQWLPEGRYRLYVPRGKADLATAFLQQVARRPLPAANKVYVVRSGDTLSHISRKTGVPIAKLKQYNRIRGSLIRVGQQLRLVP